MVAADDGNPSGSSETSSKEAVIPDENKSSGGFQVGETTKDDGIAPDVSKGGSFGQ